MLDLVLKEHQNNEIKMESYSGTYLKNKFQLRKINKEPDLCYDDIINAIDYLNNDYKKILKSAHKNAKIKNGIKNNNGFTSLLFTFPDKKEILLLIWFDYDMISGASAGYHPEYGDVIRLYPNFFTRKKEQQIYILLHEIGHVRLGHTNPNNVIHDLYGNNITNDYRTKQMIKGKAIYPEVNADLYAVLNGANIYSILDSIIKSDRDDRWDYTPSNDELAMRYHKVLKQHNNLKYKNHLFESSCRYDIDCSLLYKLIYENSRMDSLSDELKNDLYDILYEYVIFNKIANNNSYFHESYYSDLLSDDTYDDEILVNICKDIYESNSRFISVDNDYSKEIQNLIYKERASQILINEAIEIVENICEKLENKNKNNKSLTIERTLYVLESFLKSERDGEYL